jgi:Protein of unknown function (DUF3040)
MLNQEDQRRLNNIERQLEQDDPAFTVRMRRPAHSPGDRGPALVASGLTWVVVATLGFLLSWPVALGLVPLAVGLTFLFFRLARRRHGVPRM